MKKIATTVYLTEAQAARLHRLSEVTRVPMAEFIRQALDDYLDAREKREGILPLAQAKR
jgi:predicted transcriptional regulator